MFFQCTQYDNFLSFVCTSCAACGAANRAALTFGIWQLFSGVLLALELGEWCLVLRTFFYQSSSCTLCSRFFISVQQPRKGCAWRPPLASRQGVWN